MADSYNFDKTFPNTTYSEKNPGVLSDVYQLHKEDFDEKDKMNGTKTGMVDMNAACVWDKADYGNGLKKVDLSDVEFNMRQRFGLNSVDDFNSDKDDTDRGDY